MGVVAAWRRSPAHHSVSTIGVDAPAMERSRHAGRHSRWGVEPVLIGSCLPDSNLLLELDPRDIRGGDDEKRRGSFRR